MNVINRNTQVLFVSFSPWQKGRRLPTNGNVEPLIDYLLPKIKKVFLVDQPYPGSDQLMPRYENYEVGSFTLKKASYWVYLLYPFLRAVNYWEGTHISFKVRDFLSVFDCALRNITTYDFFIGLECINTLAGILLRRIGKVRRVIYYVSDYSPDRYPQKWFNSVYLWLDRYCATHADYVWDVSKAIQPARIQAGLHPKKSSPVIHVPNALYEPQIQQAKISLIEPYSLVYLGTLGYQNGPDIAVESIKYISIEYPKVKLHIIGGYGEDLNQLKKFTVRLKLKKYVVFHGFIANRDDISQAIRKYAIALAPYRQIPGSKRFYGDSTKIRTYLAAGLPVITTDVPPLGMEIVAQGAAVLINDSPESVAKAVMKIFSSKSLFLNLRKKAIGVAKENTWEKEFDNAFRKMYEFDSKI